MTAAESEADIIADIDAAKARFRADNATMVYPDGELFMIVDGEVFTSTNGMAGLSEAYHAAHPMALS